jgi:predicted nucleic acid binding AN1-type Zn finger protein
MDIIKLNKGDKVVCPHCNETYEDEERVEDFVIPRQLGAESTANEQCVHCDAYFSVTQISPGVFEVEALDDE